MPHRTDSKYQKQALTFSLDEKSVDFNFELWLDRTISKKTRRNI